MSDEQEQDGYPEATTIGPNVNAAQLELDIDAISRRTRKFLVEQQNTIDRLTAERDAARRDLNAIFELTITDVMASYDPEQIVHHVSILRKERDAALAKLESEGRE